MNPNANNQTALQPLLSMRARVAIAIAAIAVISVVWLGTERASQQAVQTTSAAIKQGTTHFTLPPVQIIGIREPAAPKATRTRGAT